MIGVDRVVACRDIEGAAEERHIIVAVDTVALRGDVDRHAVKDDTRVVARLDTVLRVAVDGQGTVAGDVDRGVCLCLESRAVICVGYIGVGGIFIVGILVIGQNDIAGDDDLYLGFLVDGNGRAGGAGQVEIFEYEYNACGAFLDGDIAVGAGAGDDIGA